MIFPQIYIYIYRVLYSSNFLGQIFDDNKSKKPTPEAYQLAPEKWWERKTILSHWVSVTFQGRTVTLPETNSSPFQKWMVGCLIVSYWGVGWPIFRGKLAGFVSGRVNFGRVSPPNFRYFPSIPTGQRSFSPLTPFEGNALPRKSHRASASPTSLGVISSILGEGCESFLRVHSVGKYPENKINCKQNVHFQKSQGFLFTEPEKNTLKIKIS